MPVSTPTPSIKSNGSRKSARIIKNVFVTRSLVLANAIILEYVTVGTKFQDFSDNAFWIESIARRCGNVGTKPFKLADASIKRAIDTFVGFVKNEMVAQTLRLPNAMQNEIKLQRLLVAPTEVQSFSQNQNKLLSILEDADRLLVLVEGAIARSLVDVAERTRIESGVRRQLRDLLRCSQRAKEDFINAISPVKGRPYTRIR